MTWVSVWAAGAAFVAGSCIAIRARMLRADQAAWTHAPGPVWGGLSLLAMGLLMSAASIVFGAAASPREAVIYSLLAIVGAVMLWNLNRNGRRAHVERQRIRAEVDAVIEAAGPARSYPWERGR